MSDFLPWIAAGAGLLALAGSIRIATWLRVIAGDE